MSIGSGIYIHFTSISMEHGIIRTGSQKRKMPFHNAWAFFEMQFLTFRLIVKRNTAISLTHLMRVSTKW